MGFAARLVLVAAVAGAAVVVYAQRRSRKTGRDIGSVLSNLPGELVETKEEMTREIRQALEAGKQAAADKEAEIDRQLEGEQAGTIAAQPPAQDYVV